MDFQTTYCVRVMLTDFCLDDFDQIVYGDGSGLGPTFDKIQLEAKMVGGSWHHWDIDCCDYTFPSNESAMAFAKAILIKFDKQISVDYIVSRSAKKDKNGMRIYKELPEALEERIQSLTPKSIKEINLQVQMITDSSCLAKPVSNSQKKTHRVTFANMQCVFSQKIRSLPVILRSAPKVVEPNMKKVMTIDDYNSEIKRLETAGWTKSDLWYDAIIDGLIKKDIEECTFCGKDLPEIGYAYDSCCILVSDYHKSEFVGWFFYNSNLDKLLNFTSYPA